MTTLLTVFAHPDDESFGMASALAKLAAAGVRTALICATASEAGQSAGPADLPDRLSVRRLFHHVATCPEDASPEGPTHACVTPEAVDVAVGIAAFEPIKLPVVRCRCTQAGDTARMPERPEGSLTAEHTMLAWSANARRPGVGCGDFLAGF